MQGNGILSGIFTTCLLCCAHPESAWSSDQPSLIFDEAETLNTCREMAESDRNFSGSFLDYLNQCISFQRIAFEGTKKNTQEVLEIDPDFVFEQLGYCSDKLLWLGYYDCTTEIVEWYRNHLRANFDAKYQVRGFYRGYKCEERPTIPSYSECLDNLVEEFPPEEEPTAEEWAKMLAKRHQEEIERAAEE